MKKFFSLFMVMVIGLFVFPFVVNAAGARIVIDDGGKNCDTPDANGFCYKTVTIRITDNTTSLNNISINVKFNSSEVVFDSFKGQNGWLNMGDTAITNKAMKLTFTNSNGAVTDSAFTIGTFVYKYPSTLSDVDCSAEFNYAGTSVTTTETTTETTTTTVNNPSTGVSLPLAILAGGLVVAGVVYYVSKRNTKMYKI